MNEGELHIDTDLVRRLLWEQFPQWAGLALTKIVSNGTDNAMYRLGDDLVVRLPRIHWAFADVEKEQRWLPYLAPHLPVAIPAPVGRGKPADGYEYEWSILQWLPGELPGGQSDDPQLARDVAGFLNALHRIDPADGPLATRGKPLAGRVDSAMIGFAGIEDLYDTRQLRAWFEAGVAAPAWDRDPVWVHADVHDENILVRDGRLAAVLDFGTAGVGDPACDLMTYWDLFLGPARTAFRDAVEADEATWLRARAWHISGAAGGLAHYRTRHEGMAARSVRGLEAVLESPL